VHVPPGSIYGRTKIEFLEAVANGISTRELPQLLVGDFNCPQFMEPTIITWAQERGKDGRWRLLKTYRGVTGKRWDEAEQKILCPRADMKDAYKFLNGVAIDTYPAKVFGLDHAVQDLRSRQGHPETQRPRSIGGRVVGHS
jgi:hypothetical protein